VLVSLFKVQNILQYDRALFAMDVLPAHSAYRELYASFSFVCGPSPEKDQSKKLEKFTIIHRVVAFHIRESFFAVGELMAE
jgi:hypothetical protein